MSTTLQIISEVAVHASKTYTGAIPQYAAYETCVAEGGMECQLMIRSVVVSWKCGVGWVGLTGLDTNDAGTGRGGDTELQYHQKVNKRWGPYPVRNGLSKRKQL